MSSQHTVEITDGPSVDDMWGTSRYSTKMRPVRLILHHTRTGEDTELNGWVEAMVPTKPSADRCRWFIRFRIARERGDFTSPYYRHFFYDSRNRKGNELPPEHPMCQLEQFLYR